MVHRIAHSFPVLTGIVASTQPSAQAIRLAIISEGTASWPLYVAQAKKMFEREGIKVDVTLTASSARQLDQLIKGGYDVGFQQSDHVVRAVERGSDLFAFMGQAHAPQLSLMVAPGINSFADLKDKDIAVDGARTGYALLLRKLLTDQGLQDGDYTLREFGGSQERFDALTGGTACAGFLNPPFDRNLLAAGFKSLGTTMDYFPTYPGSVGAARRAWARQNEQQLIAFIRAFDASYGWLRDTQNKPEAIRILLARLKMDATTAASAYDGIFRRPPPAIAPAGLRQVINIVWEAEGLKGAQGAPDRYMDLSYLEKARQAR